jgi:hypothetical protein
MLKTKEQAITSISFSLLSYIDSESKMHFKEGEINDYSILNELQTELITLKKSELLFTSTSIGKLIVTIFHNRNFVVRPVYHQQSNKYKDLLYINNDLLIMTDRMSDLIERIRK